MSDLRPALAAGGGRGATVLLILASAVILVYAMAIAIPNVFTVDGLIYRAMVDALVRDRSFEVWNGYETYHSEALNSFFMVPVGDRMMPQYPGGWAFLAAPFYALGGIRGLFLLNALATVATIWLVRATVLELSGNARAALAAALIYVFATFAFDYAGAVWPHAVTVLGIAAATAAAARSWRRDRPGWALWAGLALGLAINCRVDAILAAPAIGFWLVAASNRPWASGAAFGLGMVPGLLAAATVNYLKFGAFNPITYGRSTGATGLGHYAGLLPLVAAGALLMLALGVSSVRRVAYRPAVLAGGAVALAVLSFLPPLQPLVARLLPGAGALVIDVQLFQEAVPPAWMEQQPDGTVTLFGYHKKALLQSLPWLAGFLVLVPGLLRGRDRAGLALLLLLVCALVLPFAWSAWVGGRANHMRYFVNLLPAAAALGGLTLDRLLAEPGRSRALALLAASLAVAAGLAVGRLGNHDPIVILQISLPNLLVAALAVLAVALPLLRGPARQMAASACKGVFAASLAVACLSAWGLDLVLHQGRRAKLLTITEAVRDLPGDAVIQTVRPEAFYERIGRPPGIVASIQPTEMLYDDQLIRRVLAEGRPVYVQQQFLAEKMVADGVAASFEAVTELDPRDGLYRIAPP